ncbi:tRNA1(Val) (adenine(37)-N6)-methyltransferase [Schinkia azotoformans]|uniref:tRNA1(Val) (adenine(37)-N6)-methyltransferase n=1 Tax=Schinkia azotoformans TaxID=1454 RepID=UPI002DB9938B|nr:tRNA1(Val) (adenine(37)-N6)-methyltransferase [Schinkia azotoformans]MEC1719970.1 tRNA1(Val) (adenine(37)-N6)-methyltransferase [Schinkia azotoformans]MED4415336.1 tRNA1(Val) (adenine(37)-N6)-methyltransferase [Schinkia azotoformans]
MVELHGDERLDYLLDERMKIIQSPSVFNFSLDAVLLANFVYVPIQKGTLLDLCTGNAVIPLLLSERTKGTITGVEIQERIYDMAVRSIQYNHLEDRLSVIHGDINDIPEVLGNAGFDVVTCNPPYFPTPSETEYNENLHLAIARHEIYCTLEDVVRVSSGLVRHGGKVAFVHRPERLLDIVTLMRQYKIEPKRMRLVYPKAGKEANTLLVEGIKYGKAGLKILPPLYVYKENNEYTEEMLEILYGER